METRLRAFSLSAVMTIAILAGCGGSSTYAGMTEAQARAEAQNALHVLARKQGLTIPAHIAFLEASKSRNDVGHKVWSFKFADPITNDCVVIQVQRVSSERLVYETRDC